MSRILGRPADLLPSAKAFVEKFQSAIPGNRSGPRSLWLRIANILVSAMEKSARTARRLSRRQG